MSWTGSGTLRVLRESGAARFPGVPAAPAAPAESKSASGTAQTAVIALVPGGPPRGGLVNELVSLQFIVCSLIRMGLDSSSGWARQLQRMVSGIVTSPPRLERTVT